MRSQRQVILDHLKLYKNITTWEAFEMYGITRLSDRIFTLRKEYNITDEWVYKKNRYGKKIKFKNYKLED